MNTRIGTGVVALATAMLAAGTALAQFGKGPPTPKGQVNLVSSAETVVPGQPLDVAFHFQLAEGWHIYWQNSGDSGQPPRVDWSLPSGFQAGGLRYPVPKR